MDKDGQGDNDQRRDALLLRLLKTPPSPRPKRERKPTKPTRPKRKSQGCKSALGAAALLALAACGNPAADLSAALQRNLDMNARIAQQKTELTTAQYQRGEISAAEYAREIRAAIEEKSAADNAALGIASAPFAPGTYANPIYTRSAP
jgi:hypothetical protein